MEVQSLDDVSVTVSLVGINAYNMAFIGQALGVADDVMMHIVE